MNKILSKNTRMLLAIVLTMFLTVNIKLTAQTKNTIEYKTSIIDQNQKPMPDGNYNFRFAIYNSANGGSALWSEDRFGVQVRRAAISIDLGSINPFPQNLFKNTSLYLQVCMDANLAGGDGSGECAGAFEENFKPRKVVTGVPWAFNATSLGPVNTNTGETAYNLETFGSDSTLLNLSFNDISKFSVNSTGTVKLTTDSDIFFGDTISLRNSDSPETAGANMVGVSTVGLQNLTGNNLQTVLTNLDPLLRWKANGASVFYNGGNVGIGTNGPAYALDVVGTGNFSNGIIVGGNTNAVAGGIRFNGGNFEGFNGVVWAPLGGGSSATTDNGAGLTYVTNTTNSFAIGGATATAPFSFDPIAGALIRRNTTIRNDPATIMPNLLTLDSSGAFAQVGGNKNGITGTFAYTPNAGDGTQIYNTQESVLVINAGDGTDIDRARGFRTTIVNNSSGLVGGAFNFSGINTNNATEQFQTGLNATLQNNGTITGQMSAVTGNSNNSGDSGFFTVGVSGTTTNNVGGTTDQLAGGYFQTTNNGTTDFQYASRSIVNNNGVINIALEGTLNGVDNDGSAPVMYGFKTSASNNAPGIIGSDTFGIHNDADNAGTVGALKATYNIAANGNIVGGDLTGIENHSVNNGNVGANQRGIENDINNGGSVSGNLIGYDANVFNGGTVGGDLIGLYSAVTSSGTQGNKYGLLSTDGTTIVHLNSNDTYAIDTTGGAVKFSNQAIVGNSIGADEAGAIRFNGATFQGFDGAIWNSLGGSGFSQWGNNGADIFFDTGNVGIGTNAPDPAAMLDVNGRARIVDGLGIGQLNDFAYLLEVNGAAQFANEIVVGNSLADVTGGIRFNGTDFQGYDGVSWNNLGAGGGSSQWLNNGADIYFDTGSVGIGSTSSGNFALEVTGQIYSTNGIVTDGQVAIGTTIGAYTFEVNGSSNISGEATFGNSVGIQSAPDPAYGLTVSGFTHLTTDTRIDSALTIGVGADPGGLYTLEVTGQSLFNDNIGINTAPDNLFALNILGDVNVNGTIYVQNGALCVDGGTGCPALSPGGIYGDLAYEEFDVAENILANADVEAGDIVSGLNGQQEVVRKTEIANESTMLGVISTNPGSLGGFNLKPRDGFKVLPFVLSGRVPVKVSTENGRINVGDAITSSSVPGVGMKATDSKVKILGYAMQTYDAAGVGEIIVIFQPGYLP
ncbi:MAG: beta strand repeat-containing protein [Candidatus Dojkabacteria bacterium]